MNQLTQIIGIKDAVILTGLLFFKSVSFSQIPDGYYNSAKGLTGEQLKAALHEIIKGHIEFPYTSTSTDTWDILKETDKDTSNPNNIILFYTGWSVNAAQEYNNNTGWAREHVWAKSHGDFGTTMGAGTDAHHLRPTDISVNSARNNKDFDNGGTLYVDGDEVTECRTDADSWEPRDKVKGDVARMLFYMATRYEGDNGEPDLELVDAVNTFDLNTPGKGYHGKLSSLLEWHKIDPVDSFEIRRNNVIYSYQKNRNPFIDHPEYVDFIWTTIKTGVEVNEIKVKVYPNPAKDFLNIELSNNGNAKVTIYTMNGETFFNTEIFGHSNLSTKNIGSGLYFLKVVAGEQVNVLKLLIVK